MQGFQLSSLQYCYNFSQIKKSLQNLKAFFSKASYRSYFNRILVVQKFTFKNFKLSKHAAAKIFNFPVYVKFGIFFSNVNWVLKLPRVIPSRVDWEWNSNEFEFKKNMVGARNKMPGKYYSQFDAKSEDEILTFS